MSSDKWASPPAEQKITEWHFNILGVNMDADDAKVKREYKAQILQAHPDKNGTHTNTTAKTQMLNEAKTLLLDAQKRRDYIDDAQKRLTSTAVMVSGVKIQIHDVIYMHSLRNDTYNFMYGRVAQAHGDNSMLSSRSYVIKTQHSRRQYDVDSAGDDGNEIRISESVFEHRLRRVYGDDERKESKERWSTYYAKDDRVTIDNVQEAPWYNGMEATIMGYNYDRMRFDVLLGGQVLAFLPHNISVSKVCIETAETLPRIATLDGKSQQSSPVGGRGIPGAFIPSVGEAVEVRWQNENSHASGVRKGKKTTWYVGVIYKVYEHSDGVTTYDVKMPDTFTKKPGAIMLAVKSSEIQSRRRGGKRKATCNEHTHDI